MIYGITLIILGLLAVPSLLLFCVVHSLILEKVKD